MDKLKLITCEGGDWEVLKVVDTVEYEGHSMSNSDWIKLINDKFDFNIVTTEISDEDMENGNY